MYDVRCMMYDLTCIVRHLLEIKKTSTSILIKSSVQINERQLHQLFSSLFLAVIWKKSLATIHISILDRRALIRE